MRWTVRAVALVGVLVAMSAGAAATETYWYAPMPNYVEGYLSDGATLVGTTTTPTAGTMDVQLGSTGPVTSVVVPADDSGLSTLPPLHYYNGLYPDGGYKATTSDNVVMAYFLPLGPERYTNDAGRLLPQNALGTDYYVFAYGNPSSLDSFIAVLAIEDGTTVTVEATQPVAATGSTPALGPGFADSAVLNDYDVWMIRTQGDLSGSHVVSDKPIAVFSGHDCAVIGFSACDHISDQMVPSDLAATEFAYCSTVPDRGTGYDLIRIQSVENLPTTITLSPAPAAVPGGVLTVSGSGEYVEFQATDDVVITADHNVQVGVYMGKTGGDEGDPAMVELTPPSRYSNQRAFYVPDGWSLDLTMTIPSGLATSFDGMPVVPSRTIGTSSYQCAYAPLTTGTHYVTSTTGITIHVWATQPYASFWYEASGAILPKLRFGYDNTADTCVDSAVRFFDDGIELPPGRTVAAGGWDFGDGRSASGLKVNHTYAEAGSYEVTFSIMDDRGTVSKIKQTITSIGDLNCAPEFYRAGEGYDRSIYATRTLRACVGATDYEDDDLTYEIMPPVPYDLHFANARCLEWTPTLDQVGDWGPFPLKVTDSHGGVDMSSITIHVLPLPDKVPDRDQDGVADIQDNCPEVKNREQEDVDMDGIGDACEDVLDGIGGSGAGGRDAPTLPDRDGDGVPDVSDVCYATADPAQADLDHDGLGDACDADVDGDGIVEASADAKTLLDNCPLLGNADQADADGDGLGDACDAQPLVARPRASDVGDVGDEATQQAPIPAMLALAAIALAFLGRRRGA